MVPWEVIVTGAVGIAGIGGTLLAARMTGKSQTTNLRFSIDSENRRAQLAEKRRIYAAYLAAIETIVLAVASYKKTRRSDKCSEEEKESASREMRQARGALLRAGMEVDLIAPPAVSQTVYDVWRSLSGYAIEVIEDATRDEPQIGLTAMIEAMRLDLAIAESRHKPR